MIDLRPAADRTAALITGLSDDDLSAPTPCPEYTLGDLLDHVAGLALAFTDAATKTARQGEVAGPSGDASRLEPGWQQQIPERLVALADAWRDPEAWDGMTQAGGIEMPGEIAGLVALDEIIAHGWDIARATRQPFDADPDHVEVCIETMGPQPGEERPTGTDVAFGRPVDVPTDLAPVDRLAAVLGRDPGWSPDRS